MAPSRLSLALDQGGLTLPETGRLGVLNAPADLSLEGLDPERLALAQPFRPAFDALSARGLAVTPEPEGRYAVAVVFVPRARAWAQALVADARGRTDGPIVIDGQKTDGVESLLRAIRARVPLSGVISKAHGKIAWFEGGDFADWAEAPHQVDGGFKTLPGLFSADAPDPGSQALAAALPEALSGRGADLGAGWGWLAAQVLARPGVSALDLVEADARALACAQRNVTDPRARFHWADARQWQPEGALDFIVTNPPFHTGRKAEPELGRAFVEAARRLLAPAGTLWLVANRHLPYEASLDEAFARVEALPGAGGYKLLRASRPRRKRR